MSFVDKILKEAEKVYHGSDSDFKVFDISKSQKMGKFGIWFTDDKDFAEMFGTYVKEATIDLKNPKTITAQQWDAIRDKHAKDEQWFINWKKQLIEKGHDGLKVLGNKTKLGGFDVSNPTIYAVFSTDSIMGD